MARHTALSRGTERREPTSHQGLPNGRAAVALSRRRTHAAAAAVATAPLPGGGGETRGPAGPSSSSWRPSPHGGPSGRRNRDLPLPATPSVRLAGWPTFRRCQGEPDHCLAENPPVVSRSAPPRGPAGVESVSKARRCVRRRWRSRCGADHVHSVPLHGWPPPRCSTSAGVTQHQRALLPGGVASWPTWRCRPYIPGFTRVDSVPSLPAKDGDKDPGTVAAVQSSAEKSFRLVISAAFISQNVHEAC